MNEFHSNSSTVQNFKCFKGPLDLFSENGFTIKLFQKCKYPIAFAAAIKSGQIRKPRIGGIQKS